MKNVISVFICLLFTLGAYAQDTNAVKKTARTVKSKTEKAVKKAEPKVKKVVKKTTEKAEVIGDKVATGTKKVAVKTKDGAKKVGTKVKVESKKTVKKIKETSSNEKAPAKPDKVTGEYNGHKVYTGPRGGTYYINSNGNKTYIDLED